MGLHSLYRAMFGKQPPPEPQFKKCFAAGEGTEKCCRCGKLFTQRGEEIEFLEFGPSIIYRCRFGLCS